MLPTENRAAGDAPASGCLAEHSDTYLSLSDNLKSSQTGSMMPCMVFDGISMFIKETQVDI